MTGSPAEGDTVRMPRPGRGRGARGEAPQGIVARVRSAWRELFGDQRLAAVAALGLIGSMFLPWYQQTGFVVLGGRTEKIDDSLIAFQSWGFVEASILLVALAVLLLLFLRGERRAFHLPFGDGLVIAAGGTWVMLLVFYRQVDKPDGSESGVLKTTIGVSWGIFVAFLFGALLTYAGWRIHAHRRPEPLLDGDDPRSPVVEGDPASVAGGEALTTVAATRVMEADERATQAIAAADRPTQAIPPDERPTRIARRGGGAAGPKRGDGQFEGQLSFDDPDNQERLT
jgi:multisubunit Na+/H+ antiporter MnhB subunit